jgi:hypothetical protein
VSVTPQLVFVWLRAFPDEARRQPLKAAFYEGADRLGGLEPKRSRCSTTTRMWSWTTPSTCGRAGPVQHRRRPPTRTLGDGQLRGDAVRGPHWDESVGIREQEAWDAHAAFMVGLVDDGFILLGGPVGDHRQTLHVIQAADEEDIRRRLAEDRWAQAELREIGSIRPCALWLDFRTASSSSSRRGGAWP